MNHRVATDLEKVGALALALPVPVFQVQPAPRAVAGWVTRVLAPVVGACRFRYTYPIELRPTGCWDGWALAPEYAPDRRVSVSNRMLYRSPRALVTIFLHEVAHQLVGADHDHDAAFFATNLMLLLRVRESVNADVVPAGGALADMGLYDIQAPPVELQREPDAGVGRAVSWAISVAHEFAPQAMTAEDAAAEIRARYAAWIAQLAAAPATAAAARAQAAAGAAVARSELRRANALLRTRTISLGVAGLFVLVEAFLVIKLGLAGG
ncbi:hypothetical protein [Variovorax sp. EL159]|uniref:hypothetical protein n=1 Tax=Variovorax sp. EL159 TaxID=1566270 RepID=UPI000880D4BD|nr:hypothetical protein [Variovorax sp. EL159]SCX48755.1 hypothetical protein SAMN03159363_1219 [Variovorax sp. EL159]